MQPGQYTRSDLPTKGVDTMVALRDTETGANSAETRFPRRNALNRTSLAGEQARSENESLQDDDVSLSLYSKRVSRRRAVSTSSEDTELEKSIISSAPKRYRPSEGVEYEARKGISQHEDGVDQNKIPSKSHTPAPEIKIPKKRRSTFTESSSPKLIPEPEMASASTHEKAECHEDSNQEPDVTSLCDAQETLQFNIKNRKIIKKTKTKVQKLDSIQKKSSSVERVLENNNVPSKDKKQWPPAINKLMTIENDVDGFLYLGFHVKVVVRFDDWKNKSSWVWAEGIIKYWNPKFKRFFIHFLKKRKSSSTDVCLEKASQSSDTDESSNQESNDFGIDLWKVPQPHCSLNIGERGWFSINDDEIRLLSSSSIWTHPLRLSGSLLFKNELKSKFFVWYSTYKISRKGRHGLLDTFCALCGCSVTKSGDLTTSTINSGVEELNGNNCQVDSLNLGKTHHQSDTPLSDDSTVRKCCRCSKVFHVHCLPPHQALYLSFVPESLLCREAKEHRKYCHEVAREQKLAKNLMKQSKVPTTTATTKKRRKSCRLGNRLAKTLKFHSSPKNERTRSSSTQLKFKTEFIRDQMEIGDEEVIKTRSSTRRHKASRKSSQNWSEGESGEESVSSSGIQNDSDFSDELKISITKLTKNKKRRIQTSENERLKVESKKEVLVKVELNEKTHENEESFEELGVSVEPNGLETPSNFAESKTSVIKNSMKVINQNCLNPQLLINNVSIELLNCIQKQIRHSKGKISNEALTRVLSQCSPNILNQVTPAQLKLVANFIRARERLNQWQGGDATELQSLSNCSFYQIDCKKKSKFTEEQQSSRSTTLGHQVVDKNEYELSDQCVRSLDLTGLRTQEAPEMDVHEVEGLTTNESSECDQERQQQAIWVCPDCLICRYCDEPLNEKCEVETSKLSVLPQLDAAGNPFIVTDSVVCHTCGLAAHGSCCFPEVPLLHPNAKWRCDRCTRCKGCGYRDVHWSDYTGWDVSFQYCVHCYQTIERGEYCPICSGIWGTYEGTWLQCDGCRLWVHTGCDASEAQRVLFPTSTPLDSTASMQNRGTKDPRLASSSIGGLIPYRCPVCRSVDQNKKYLRTLDQLIVFDKSKCLSYPVPRTFINYWRVVKRPMNFSEMKVKVYRLDYATDEQFITDFALIIHNAKIVHMPNTRIYRIATTIERRGYELITSILNTDKFTKQLFIKFQNLAMQLASTPSTTPPIVTDVNQCTDLEKLAASSLLKDEITEAEIHNGVDGLIEVQSVCGSKRAESDGDDGEETSPTSNLFLTNIERSDNLRSSKRVIFNPKSIPVDSDFSHFKDVMSMDPIKMIDHEVSGLGYGDHPILLSEDQIMTTTPFHVSNVKKSILFESDCLYCKAKIKDTFNNGDKGFMICAVCCHLVHSVCTGILLKGAARDNNRVAYYFTCKYCSRNCDVCADTLDNDGITVKRDSNSDKSKITWMLSKDYERRSESIAMKDADLHNLMRLVRSYEREKEKGVMTGAQCVGCAKKIHFSCLWAAQVDDSTTNRHQLRFVKVVETFEPTSAVRPNKAAAYVQLEKRHNESLDQISTDINSHRQQQHLFHQVLPSPVTVEAVIDSPINSEASATQTSHSADHQVATFQNNMNNNTSAFLQSNNSLTSPSCIPSNTSLSSPTCIPSMNNTLSQRSWQQNSEHPRQPSQVFRHSSSAQTPLSSNVFNERVSLNNNNMEGQSALLTNYQPNLSQPFSSSVSSYQQPRNPSLQAASFPSLNRHDDNLHLHPLFHQTQSSTFISPLSSSHTNSHPSYTPSFTAASYNTSTNVPSFGSSVGNYTQNEISPWPDPIINERDTNNHHIYQMVPDQLMAKPPPFSFSHSDHHSAPLPLEGRLDDLLNVHSSSSCDVSLRNPFSIHPSTPQFSSSNSFHSNDVTRTNQILSQSKRSPTSDPKSTKSFIDVIPHWFIFHEPSQLNLLSSLSGTKTKPVIHQISKVWDHIAKLSPSEHRNPKQIKSECIQQEDIQSHQQPMSQSESNLIRPVLHLTDVLCNSCYGQGTSLGHQKPVDTFLGSFLRSQEIQPPPLWSSDVPVRDQVFQPTFQIKNPSDSEHLQYPPPGPRLICRLCSSVTNAWDFPDLRDISCSMADIPYLCEVCRHSESTPLNLNEAKIQLLEAIEAICYDIRTRLQNTDFVRQFLTSLFENCWSGEPNQRNKHIVKKYMESPSFMIYRPRLLGDQLDAYDLCNSRRSGINLPPTDPSESRTTSDPIQYQTQGSELSQPDQTRNIDPNSSIAESQSHDEPNLPPMLRFQYWLCHHPLKPNGLNLFFADSTDVLSSLKLLNTEEADDDLDESQDSYEVVNWCNELKNACQTDKLPSHWTPDVGQHRDAVQQYCNWIETSKTKMKRGSRKDSRDALSYRMEASMIMGLLHRFFQWQRTTGRTLGQSQGIDEKEFMRLQNLFFSLSPTVCAVLSKLQKKAKMFQPIGSSVSPSSMLPFDFLSAMEKEEIFKDLQHSNKSNSLSCSLCGRLDCRPLGLLLPISLDSSFHDDGGLNEYVHSECLLWSLSKEPDLIRSQPKSSSTMTFDNSFLLQKVIQFEYVEVMLLLELSEHQICQICGNEGATVCCQTCHDEPNFHVPCLLQLLMQQQIPDCNYVALTLEGYSINPIKRSLCCPKCCSQLLSIDHKHQLDMELEQTTSNSFDDSFNEQFSTSPNCIFKDTYGYCGGWPHLLHHLWNQSVKVNPIPKKLNQNDVLTTPSPVDHFKKIYLPVLGENVITLIESTHFNPSFNDQKDYLFSPNVFHLLSRCSIFDSLDHRFVGFRALRKFWDFRSRQRDHEMRFDLHFASQTIYQMAIDLVDNQTIYSLSVPLSSDDVNISTILSSEEEWKIVAIGTSLTICMENFFKLFQTTNFLITDSLTSSISNSRMSCLDFFGLTCPDMREFVIKQFQCQQYLDLLSCGTSLATPHDFVGENNHLKKTSVDIRNLIRGHRTRIWLSTVPPRRRPQRELGHKWTSISELSSTNIPTSTEWSSSKEQKDLLIFTASPSDFVVNEKVGRAHAKESSSIRPLIPTVRQGLRTERPLSRSGTSRLSSRQNFDRMPAAMQYRHLLAKKAEEKVQAHLSPIHGLGLFAVKQIAKGDPVVEYVGDKIRNVIADKREKFYMSEGINDASCYMFRLDHNYVVDATTAGNVARFINHSCEPNCYCRVITSENETQHIVIFASREIQIGEEITYDYKFNVEEESLKIVCHCGAPSCLGRMN